MPHPQCLIQEHVELSDVQGTYITLAAWEIRRGDNERTTRNGARRLA